MSRSGYTDDCFENWSMIRWRGQVASAIRGKRGQAFLCDLVEALDEMPEKRLIANDLRRPYYVPSFGRVYQGGVCAIGALGEKRGINLEALDPHDYDKISGEFGVAHQLVQEIEWLNDDAGLWRETPEHRWSRLRTWAASQIKEQSHA